MFLSDSHLSCLCPFLNSLMFTEQSLKISRNQAKCRSLSFFEGTKGYGTYFPIYGIASFFFSRASSLLVFFTLSFSLVSRFFSFSSFSSSRFLIIDSVLLDFKVFDYRLRALMVGHCDLHKLS